ncbi:TPA: hypothetical protein LA742_002696 [Clostridium botulinum]|uniref:DUF3021 domain-containing protein n=3 Tax=Clostridium TaxID=1485 RepID=A0ABC8CYT7_CLOBO|nr:hypothetical protein RSJ11_13400 [Clostridium sporogenes]AVQ39397.1 hypothetical protein C7M56_12195 [Clostridium botulinum]AVQ53547.1 hypothetical protein C7M59_12010 [Clostridium botulinum]HBJ2614208.1 hypothetical protein [Clostridium botulinum]
MNKKSGFYSAMAVTITTFLFAVGMIIGNDTASYFVCMLLSWGYILLTCSFAVEVTHERKALAYWGMAISTLLIGMIINTKNKPDKWLKALLMVHGIFAPACVIMPMLIIFNSHMGPSGDFIGIIVLLIWCTYFIPIGILSTMHFKKNNVNL